MPDADSTRDRIITAAKREFATYGITGARIERIAKEARTSKERLYAYFRSKEALYAHVTNHELAAVVASTHLDPSDLPGYAGQVFDYFHANPDHLRLVNWGRLELTENQSSGDFMENTIRRKVEQLRTAQQEGFLDPTWDPVDVLALVNQIAITWCSQPEMWSVANIDGSSNSLAARRAAVVEAVRRLFSVVKTSHLRDVRE